MYKELVDFLSEARKTAEDQVALKAKKFYPPFEKIKNTWQKKGARCRYEVNGKEFLFKLTCENQTEQGTYILENWNPVDAASIWTPIDETHAGTLKDPIPAVSGMEYEYGKYYIEGETVYLCTRLGESEGGKITLYALPSALVGNYFEVAKNL